MREKNALHSALSTTGSNFNSIVHICYFLVPKTFSFYVLLVVGLIILAVAEIEL